MKRIITTFLSVVLALSISACGTVKQANNTNNATGKDNAAVQTDGNSDLETESEESIKEKSSKDSGDPVTVADADQEFEQGKKAVRGDIKVVNLQGTWREMGRQYGHLMKKELEDVKAFIDSIKKAKKGNADKADDIVEEQTAQTPFRICEFFEGAAETSGLTVDELQTINAVERIGGLPKCSVAMAWDEYAASDLIIGRNYDYSDIFASLKDAIAVTVYHPDDGALATATIGYVGEIYAVNGINEKGIFLELNNGKPSANISPPDQRVTGTTMLFECLFEADELEDMDLFFNTVNCSSSYIINVADDKEGQSYEWCPIGVKQGGQDLPKGLLVSTNYYVNPDWEFKVPSDKDSWASLTRRKNLIKLCKDQKGQIDENKMMEIINKTEKEGGAKNELTVYQMVVVPKSQTLWLQIVGGSSWTKIALNDFLKNKK